jgi:hypothetical protein
VSLLRQYLVGQLLCRTADVLEAARWVVLSARYAPFAGCLIAAAASAVQGLREFLRRIGHIVPSGWRLTAVRACQARFTPLHHCTQDSRCDHKLDIHSRRRLAPATSPPLHCIRRPPLKRSASLPRPRPRPCSLPSSILSIQRIRVPPAHDLHTGHTVALLFLSPRNPLAGSTRGTFAHVACAA